GLKPGETLPDFALPDPDGRTVRREELLDDRPLALTFFRGCWCPYCDAALRALERARPEIEAAGGRLVAVAPETPAELRRTGAARGLGFLLLSDPDGRYARLCGVRYDESEQIEAVYRRLDAEFPVRDRALPWSLPLPAAYAVGRDGVIAHVFVDPDWSYRIEPIDLVRAVQALAQAAAADRVGVSASSTNDLTGGE
ncbi:MAG TPA: peroxiredoxin-like family protein, partial [Geminicoccaceae bacterium]|nr:peroxiredoxin-like family protein [Geminicoccaceae bacterium]